MMWAGRSSAVRTASSSIPFSVEKEDVGVDAREVERRGERLIEALDSRREAACMIVLESVYVTEEGHRERE
jgi:hypothetical protein